MHRLLYGLLALPFALLAQESPYGVCAHVGGGQEAETAARALPMMAQAGFRHVRADFSWGGIQPKPGEWHFATLDTVIAEAEKNSITLLPILDYNSSFANPAWQHLDAWCRYVEMTVRRYEKRLPVWEVWNEQNLEGFWKNANPTNYVTLLKATYATIKRVNPNLKVAIGGFAGIPLEFIEAVYQVGGKEFFDIMNVHPYSHPAAPELTLEKRLVELQQLMAKYGDGKKPVWITENGWPTQKQRMAAPGLLKRALELAKPGKTEWTFAVIDDPACETLAAASDAFLASDLTPTTKILRTTFDQLPLLLDKHGADAVMLPMDEAYPPIYFDKIMAFVKAGGVLISMGGMPLYYAYDRKPDGSWHKTNGEGYNLHAHRRALRFQEEAWWYTLPIKPPQTMNVSPTAALSDTPSVPKQLEATRFFSAHNLKPGDECIPLFSGQHSNYTGHAAVVIRYNSDLKGALILSGLFEQGRRGSTEEQQSRLIPRAYMIAQQLGVERIYNYEFQAPEVDDLDQESHFGIIHRDFSPKPAYRTFSVYTQQRPAGSVIIESANWKNDSLRAYYPQWKRPDNTIGGAVWTYRNAATFRVTFTSDTIVFVNHCGERLTPTHDGATYTLALDDAPLYFTGGTLLAIQQ